MSETVERRILEMLGHPTVSPYGNPIPGLAELDQDRRGRRPRRASPRSTRSCATTPPASRSRASASRSRTTPRSWRALRRAGALPGATVKVVALARRRARRQRRRVRRARRRHRVARLRHQGLRRTCRRRASGRPSVGGPIGRSSVRFARVCSSELVVTSVTCRRGALGSPVAHPPVGAAGGRRVLPPPAGRHPLAGAGDPLPGPPHTRRVLGVKPVSRPAGPTPGPNPTAHLVGVVEEPWRLLARVSARPSAWPSRPRCSRPPSPRRPRPRPAVVATVGATVVAATPVPRRTDRYRAHRALGRVVLSRRRCATRCCAAARVISVAKRLAGIRYVAGGTTPRSRLRLLGLHQVRLHPARHLDAARLARPVRLGDQIRASQAVPGDLVFFHHGGRVYHARSTPAATACGTRPTPASA